MTVGVRCELLVLLVFEVCPSLAVWDLTKQPWACGTSCYRSISVMRTTNRGCLQRNETTEYFFQLLQFDRFADPEVEGTCVPLRGSRRSICVRNNTGQYFIGTCNEKFRDARITCRREFDRMTWYRGFQSTTVSNGTCIRWDSLRSQLPASAFEAYQSPSVTFVSQTSLSSGSHQHENYCRNPDNSPTGPWCVVRTRKGRLLREKCFRTCQPSTAKELCLTKMLFPYTLESRKPVPRASPSVEPYRERVEDLSDLLDVPAVIDFNESNRAMFEPTLFNDYLRRHSGDLSTRLRCYQRGRQTRIAGPWIYSAPPNSGFMRRFHEWFSRSKHGIIDEMLLAPKLAGDYGPEYTLWRPCFLACEDTKINCWPADQSNFSRPRFPYYGPRDTDFKGRKCVSPAEGFLELFFKPATNRTVSDKVYLDIFQETYLNDSRKARRIKNIFSLSNGKLMISNRCFTLGDFLRGLDWNARKVLANQSTVFRDVISIGAGCFVKLGNSVSYTRCFESCSCNRRKSAPSVYDDNCGETEVCATEYETLGQLAALGSKPNVKPHLSDSIINPSLAVMVVVALSFCAEIAVVVIMFFRA